MLAAVEGGGTKFVLAIGRGPDEIVARHVIPTRGPAETVAEAAAWFAQQPPTSALGLATFGPLELDPQNSAWGHLLDTPKPGWAGFDVAGAFANALGVPVALETDVNAAALAEWRAGGPAGGSSLAYMTVGTGIGVGLVIAGACVHGAAHPEMGHAYPRREPDDRDFSGVCPFHGDCFEGLASGPAIIERWGARLSDLPPGHAAHDLVAGYLAQACHTLFAALAIETIVLGGGVMATAGLLERVRERTRLIDHGYLPGRSRQQVRAPLLGGDAGISGALLLAQPLAAPG
jgi:fructokinase